MHALLNKKRPIPKLKTKRIISGSSNSETETERNSKIDCPNDFSDQPEQLKSSLKTQADTKFNLEASTDLEILTKKYENLSIKYDQLVKLHEPSSKNTRKISDFSEDSAFESATSPIKNNPENDEIYDNILSSSNDSEKMPEDLRKQAKNCIELANLDYKLVLRASWVLHQNK